MSFFDEDKHTREDALFFYGSVTVPENKRTASEKTAADLSFVVPGLMGLGAAGTAGYLGMREAKAKGKIHALENAKNKQERDAALARVESDSVTKAAPAAALAGAGAGYLTGAHVPENLIRATKDSAGKDVARKSIRELSFGKKLLHGPGALFQRGLDAAGAKGGFAHVGKGLAGVAAIGAGLYAGSKIGKGSADKQIKRMRDDREKTSSVIGGAALGGALGGIGGAAASSESDRLKGVLIGAGLGALAGGGAGAAIRMFRGRGAGGGAGGGAPVVLSKHDVGINMPAEAKGFLHNSKDGPRAFVRRGEDFVEIKVPTEAKRLLEGKPINHIIIDAPVTTKVSSLDIPLSGTGPYSDKQIKRMRDDREKTAAKRRKKAKRRMTHVHPDKYNASFRLGRSIGGGLAGANLGVLGGIMAGGRVGAGAALGAGLGAGLGYGTFEPMSDDVIYQRTSRTKRKNVQPRLLANLEDVHPDILNADNATFLSEEDIRKEASYVERSADTRSRLIRALPNTGMEKSAGLFLKPSDLADSHHDLSAALEQTLNNSPGQSQFKKHAGRAESAMIGAVVSGSMETIRRNSTKPIEPPPVEDVKGLKGKVHKAIHSVRYEHDRFSRKHPVHATLIAMGTGAAAGATTNLGSNAMEVVKSLRGKT